ncbi:MAG TPA: branched-chain amino acid ABC transporter permease, partial [Rhizobiales bacterium]|nr:branched-chain amino acid ABC transporter permease [Hyphomicrobiales bacterium]
MMAARRELILFSGLAVFIALILLKMGSAFTLRMMIEATCYAIIALGLNIQWGYAGLFNIGIMGFIAVGGFFTMLVSFPINDKFWNSTAPGGLGMVGLYLLVGIALTWGASRLNRLGLSKKLRNAITIIVFAISYLVVMSALAPVADQIESTAGFIGG